MARLHRRRLGFCAALWLSLAGLVSLSGVRAEVVTLKTGLQLEGALANISEIGETPLAGGAPQGKATRVLMLDDELRRTYVPEHMVRTGGLAQGHATGHEIIRLDKRVAKSGHRVAVVGPILGVEPFDKYGNRIFAMQTGLGRVDVVQGITEITPLYTKIEGLLIEGKSYVWDMRMKTTSLPRATLTNVIMRAIDQTNPDDRLRIVRLYIQAERYEDAERELQAAMTAFPELANLKQQVTALRQLAAGRLIREIELRRDAGQHLLAQRLLDEFPEEGIAGETLLRVSDMLDDYKDDQKQAEIVLKRLQQHYNQLTDAGQKARIEPILQEIAAELNQTTLDRMAAYLRLVDDQKLSVGQKLALAISGWLLGSDAGEENLAVAMSLHDVRNAVRDYLRATRQGERDAILERLSKMEGSQPSYLAKLIARMKPPIPAPADAALETPGMGRLTVPGLAGDPPIAYYVQLPPEYDPHRHYPCIVTLNGSGTTPQLQMDWWAGMYSKEAGMRLGQAMRRGYIVVAPVWRESHQRKYRFSAREHAAVLYSLWDACRHFNIDTDRVFLSGHSIGGDAAWDIGLAHPDLWAGVIPIVATADKYVELYWENGRRLPMYFVGGQLDGSKVVINANQWNRYLTRHSYDTMVSLYHGRGHEDFHDEIQRIFEWMTLHRRDFFPREFLARSMRPWDNYFWWAELRGFPESSMVVPAAWPAPSRSRPATVEGWIYENNRVRLTTSASQATVWLAPEFIDFSQRVTVSFNRYRSRPEVIEPDSRVLLEDVRRRGDRLHPFWAKVEVGRPAS